MLVEFLFSKNLNENVKNYILYNSTSNFWHFRLKFFENKYTKWGGRSKLKTLDLWTKLNQHQSTQVAIEVFSETRFNYYSKNAFLLKTGFYCNIWVYVYILYMYIFVLLIESGVGSRWNIFNKNWGNFYKEYKMLNIYRVMLTSIWSFILWNPPSILYSL